MRKITFFFFLFFSAISFAQFTTSDVKYFVGTGSNTAYLVVDFKDGTDDRSYAWGIRFDSNNPINGIDMLELLAQEEPNFSFQQTGGFLDQIAFNSHDSYQMDYDNWSLWASLDGTNWTMDGWMSVNLVDGKWYGASYGFGMSVPGPDAPVTPIPAYSSQWLSDTDITKWIGSGSNQSLIVIDFGTTTNGLEDSFVFGIKYNGVITAEDALKAINTEFPSFTFTLNNSSVNGISLGSYNVVNTTAAIYKGTDLSNWTTQTNFTSTSLTNNEWLGISFGDRRPFIPKDGNAVLDTNKFNSIKYNAYPNPSSDIITIEIDDVISNVSIYNMVGAKVLNSTNNQINISHLSNGTYIMEVKTDQGTGVKKIVKK